MRLDPRNELCPEIRHGERLLWYGQPLQGIRFRHSDLLTVPCGLIPGSLALCWQIMAMTDPKAPPVFVWLWLPVVGLTAWMVFGRLLADAARRARTFYAVTDERILIVSGRWARTLKSLPLRNIADISVTCGMLACGTITFGTASSSSSLLRNALLPPARFEMVENVKGVYELIRFQQRAAQLNWRCRVNNNSVTAMIDMD